MKRPEQEQTRGILTTALLPKKEWFDSRSSWYEEAKLARAKAHRAVEMAASQAEELEVVMPAALVAALRSVSCAPAVHWVLDLVEKGLTAGVAVALTEALNSLQVEGDVAQGMRPWPWAEWETAGGDLVWATGSGRSVFKFSPAGGSLTRFAGERGEATGEWIFGPSGLEDGWVDPRDDRATQLTYHLGGLSLSPQDSEQVELAELEWAAKDLAALSHSAWGRLKKRPACRNPDRAERVRHRTVKRRADRQRKQRETWDRPVA